MSGRHTFTPRQLLTPAVVLLAFWALGLWGWLASGFLQPLLMFGYIGTSLGVGLTLFATLPREHRPHGRRLTLFLVGMLLLSYVGFHNRENIQIEGFFFGLLTGFVQAAVMHYLIAKVIGPVLFGRLWCGWACWTVMVLDLLPFKRPAGRVPGAWDRLRYVHFALSLALVLVLWGVFAYGLGVKGAHAVWWFVAGNATYYAAGIALAYALRDNRAFCKYLCPLAVILKVTSRFAVMKVAGDAAKCDDCGACVELCPMDIRVPDYILRGQRVLSTECSLCQTCISICPQDALKLSFRFDLGGTDRLRNRGEPARRAKAA